MESRPPQWEHWVLTFGPSGKSLSNEIYNRINLIHGSIKWDYICSLKQSLAHNKCSICTAAAAANSSQSCPTPRDPIDGSPPGSSVPGILQARTLEWVAISFSNPWKWKVKVKLLSRVRLLAAPWTIAYQAPPSMGFPRQEYWSGVPLPSSYH